LKLTTAAITWAASAASAATALVLGAAQHFSLVIDTQTVFRGLLFVAAPLGLACYGTWRKSFAFIVTPCHAAAQFSAFAITILVLQFPLASLNRPAIDEALVRFDALFGASWLDHFDWMISHPPIFHFLYFVYRSLLLQVPIACAVVGFLDERRLRSFILANTLALLAVVTIATIWPAGGAFALYFTPPYPAEMATQFVAVRSGALRMLDPAVITGIIAFPSYHTILAILLGLAFVGIPRLRLLVFIYEGVIIFSTRAIGGHYYADIIAGFALALASNYLATRITGAVDGAKSGHWPALTHSLGVQGPQIISMPPVRNE
jgi:hypothetical protein